jgi:predicted PurR-regulated permease PerM
MPTDSSEKKITLNISTATLLKIGIFCLLSYLAIELRGLVLVILCAVVIASVIEPGTRWLTKKGIQRVFAAMIMYLAIATGFTAVFTFVLPPLFFETVNATAGEVISSREKAAAEITAKWRQESTTIASTATSTASTAAIT